MYGALDMLLGEPILKTTADTCVPLLAPCQAHDEGELREEIAGLLEQGFRTLKIKVGFDWRDDLERPSSTANPVFPTFCSLGPNKIKHLGML